MTPISLRDATPQNIEATVARGMALWNSIYQPHAVKLYNKLGDLHPDFISTWPSLHLLTPPVECTASPSLCLAMRMSLIRFHRVHHPGIWNGLGALAKRGLGTRKP